MNCEMTAIEVDPSVANAIRWKAAQLIGTNGFAPAEREDLEQDMLHDCLRRLRRFDPSRSSRRGFQHRVVRHRASTLVEAQRAGRRDFRLCRDSLDAPVQLARGESIPLRDTISADDYDARSGRSALPSCQRTELQIDVAGVIAGLPPELRPVAAELKSATIVEASRRLGISRATVYRHIGRIREVFAAAGLDRYLGPPDPAAVCGMSGARSYSGGGELSVARAGQQKHSEEKLCVRTK